MIKLSVVVITFNEERNIARCLESVKDIADEIIVVDSYSKDNTAAIARKHNAKVIENTFIGYGEQKNLATALSSNDWVLSLDADEAISAELKDNILKVKNGPTFNVYEMPRLNNYCGQWIKYCGWYPDKKPRLYNRTIGRWEEKKVHEYWRSDSPQPIGQLKGDLLHYSFSSVNDHLTKIEKYSELSAREAVEKGKDATLAKIYFSPLWHFVSEYFIKMGFLDGFYGFVICRLSAYAAFSKSTKIRMYNRQK